MLPQLASKTPLDTKVAAQLVLKSTLIALALIALAGSAQAQDCECNAKYDRDMGNCNGFRYNQATCMNQALIDRSACWDVDDRGDKRHRDHTNTKPDNTPCWSALLNNRSRSNAAPLNLRHAPLRFVDDFTPKQNPGGRACQSPEACC
jgi:hypothetical protein